jgi:hypothetical protein
LLYGRISSRIALTVVRLRTPVCVQRTTSVQTRFITSQPVKPIVENHNSDCMERVAVARSESQPHTMCRTVTNRLTRISTTRLRRKRVNEKQLSQSAHLLLNTRVREVDMGNTFRLYADRDDCSAGPRYRKTDIPIAVDPAIRELLDDFSRLAGLDVADASSLNGGLLREQHFGRSVSPSPITDNAWKASAAHAR